MALNLIQTAHLLCCLGDSIGVKSSNAHLLLFIHPPQADKALLRQELPNLRPECIRVLELTTALLKRCVEAGMNLFEIGNLMSRPFVDANEDPSELEMCCEEARRALEVGSWV